MRETAPELEGLQALIDRSLAQTRPHMRAIVHPGKYSPNGDPLVAPMDGWFVHGKFYFSSSGDAVNPWDGSFASPGGMTVATVASFRPIGRWMGVDARVHATRLSYDSNEQKGVCTSLEVGCQHPCSDHTRWRIQTFGSK